MNEQEAIKHLNLITENEAYSGYFQDVCKLAIQALEKQVPKEAKLIDRFYDEARNCPSCGKITDYNGKEFFCKKCGQKLKWS